jgi:hypothetical protein
MIPVAKRVWDDVEFMAWKQVDNQLAILYNTAFDEVSWQVKSQVKEQVQYQMRSKMQ